MRSYRHKPTIVQAIQHDGTAKFRREICELFPEAFALGVNESDTDGPLFFIADEGAVEIAAGDWIIRGVGGNPYPCPASDFEESYEVVE